MDRPVGVCLDLGLFDVQRLAENVEDVALDAVADGHGDGRTGVPHSGAADEAVGCCREMARTRLSPRCWEVSNVMVFVWPLRVISVVRAL